MNIKAARIAFLSLALLVGPDDCTGPTSDESRQEQEKSPRPDDKGVNEGAMGRRNATESAARSAESPIGEKRP
jgi:hypothetical protein